MIFPKEISQNYFFIPSRSRSETETFGLVVRLKKAVLSDCARLEINGSGKPNDRYFPLHLYGGTGRTEVKTGENEEVM